jgi:translation initiation factor RLI1
MKKQKIRLGTTEISGNGQLVIIIGPNWAGKSRFGVSIARENNRKVDRVSAKRYILPPERFAFRSEDEVKQKYEQSMQEYKQDHYKYSDEFSPLLVKLFAEETSPAFSFKNQFHEAPG